MLLQSDFSVIEVTGIPFPSMTDDEAELECLKTEITILEALIDQQQKDSDSCSPFAALGDACGHSRTDFVTVNRSAEKIIFHAAGRFSGCR